jgi:mono/diheme cytochrome c family protein
MERKHGAAAPGERFRRFCSAMTIAVVASVFRCPTPVLAQNEPGDGGEKVFMQNNCFVCHGQQGFGGIGPAFRSDPFLTLNDYVVGQILMGRGVMPPFSDKLDDNQIAAVATYVRNSWGNHFGAIRPDQVAQIRHELDAFRPQAASSSPETTGSAHPLPGAR